MSVENVWKGLWDNAFALVRPPGHHAGAIANEIEGFCIYNNVAIACRRLLQMGAKRIAVLDWDVHHGNSTQKIFYKEKEVLYISIHKFLNGAFYPC